MIHLLYKKKDCFVFYCLLASSKSCSFLLWPKQDKGWEAPVGQHRQRKPSSTVHNLPLLPLRAFLQLPAGLPDTHMASCVLPHCQPSLGLFLGGTGLSGRRRQGFAVTSLAPACWSAGYQHRTQAKKGLSIQD